MRLWIVNHYAYTPSDSAGTRHYSIAKRLIDRGHHVTIVASSFYHKARRERLQEGGRFRRETVDQVPFVWLRTPAYKGNGLSRFWNMLVFALGAWKGTGLQGETRPDVIIGSSPDLLAALAAMRLARRFRVPFVLEVRDMWPDTLVELGSFGKGNPFIRVLEMIERLLYRRAHLIVSVLPEAAPRMIEKGADPRSIVWIPNGVDLDMVPQPVPSPSIEPLVAMYAGAHGLANALGSILDAAELLQAEGWSQRVRLRLVGDGPERAHLIDAARARSLTNIEFLEGVPKREAYRLMQEADILILTLKDSPLFRWGISPNKLPDYLASARPVILSVVAPSNAVEASSAGIVIPPENGRAMADAIKELVDLSPEERWEMGSKGRRHVEEKYDFDALAEQIEALLTDLISGARSGEAR